MQNTKFGYLGILLLTLLLSGCISHSLGLTFATDDKLNPDSEWQSLPVQVKVIQLRNSDAFTSADFDDLWKAPQDALGDGFIKETSYMLLPNSERTITLATDPHANYIGFVAVFRTHSGNSWRVLKAVPRFYFFYPSFSISLTGHTISVH
jgi:type VI secretion system protein VasD